MADATRLYARMRLAQYENNVQTRLRQAHKRGGMELRDAVKESLNVPGYQVRQKGEVMTTGFVIRKAERIDMRDDSGRFIKGMKAEEKASSARGLIARKNEYNYDVVRSKPGEPPRRQRGALYQSMTYETRESFRGIFTRVGPSVTVAKYARALELGYPPNNLEPRPYLRPAAKKFRPHWIKLIDRATKGARA